MSAPERRTLMAEEDGEVVGFARQRKASGKIYRRISYVNLLGSGVICSEPLG
jgi:hypothetical protein